MRIRTFVLGGLAGAAIAYLIDPIGGRGRRARLVEQVSGIVARVRGGSPPDVPNVAPGAMFEVTETELVVEIPAALDERPDDATLADRIHSTVFGEPDVPADRLAIDVVDGVVTLRGELDSREEIDDIAGRIALVPDVLEVDVLVHLPGEPAPNKEAAIQASREAEMRPAPGGSTSETGDGPTDG